MAFYKLQQNTHQQQPPTLVYLWVHLANHFGKLVHDDDFAIHTLNILAFTRSNNKK